MTCASCGQGNPATAKFCNGCGARLDAPCPACGHVNPPASRFCNECGGRLDGAPPSGGVPVARPLAAPAGTAPEPRLVSPESYTPRHLAEKIITSRGALEGERKLVTVLFADLKGSMELLADRDPEEARALLDPVLQHMMSAVHQYEGTVNQVMGDGIMALFGAPLSHEDHAVRACYAALRMQDAVRRYAEEVHRTAGVPIHIRVGLNSGDVVVRSIGSDLHMDYTAVGQTTHLAARMEQMAMPGSILLTPHTLALAEGYVLVKALGARPVKGVEAPLEVYELTGAGAARSRIHAAATRGLTRFVGREIELDLLRQAVERAGAGHGQMVAVVGEAGVGKSRLFWEFTHSHRTQGWMILESSSVSYGKATAYLPMLDLLRAYFQVEPRDDARRVRERVTGRLLALDRALEPWLPALCWLLDVPVEDPEWERLTPAQRRQRALDGVKALLLRESQGQPLLVVFEDLHWIDAETQAFLDSLVESLPTARLLLLVNYRPEYRHGWSVKTYYRQLRLDPLPPESAEGLLDGLLGTDPSLAPLRALLIERTEGNPFFLEESVRALVETAALAGERGAYRLDRAPANIQIPASARAILSARIDRLAPDDKRVLQAASVIGKDVPLALLEAIADGHDDVLRQSLGRLQAAEFLYEARLFPDLEYTFRHALTHEVAYGSLLQERRRALHARIVEAVEALTPDRRGEEVERLAHHAFRGEVWPKAVRYQRQAGRRANSRCAFREAASYFGRALESLERLPDSREKTEQAIDGRFDLRNVLIPLGDLEPIRGHLGEAERLAREIGDQRRSGRACSLLANYLQLVGDHERALEWGARARAAARELGDRSLELAANLYLGQTHHARGEYRQAVDVLARNEEALSGGQPGDRLGETAFRLITGRTWSVWSHAELGEFGKGLPLAQEAVKIAEAAGHPGALVSAYLGIGVLHLRQGDLDRATAVLERGVELSREASIAAIFPFLAGALGAARTLLGRAKEAVPLLEDAVAQAAARGMMGGQPLRLAQLGEGWLLAREPGRALEAAGAAIDLARRLGERGHEAWALRLLGEIHGSRGDLDPALEAFAEARRLAGTLGMQPLLAHCDFGMGTLCRAGGRREMAASHLEAAKTLLRDLNMWFWLEQAEVEAGQLG